MAAQAAKSPAPAATVKHEIKKPAVSANAPTAAPIKLSEIETLKAQLMAEKLRAAGLQNNLNNAMAQNQVLQNKITLIMSKLDGQEFQRLQKEAKDLDDEIHAAHPGSDGLVTYPEKGELAPPPPKVPNNEQAQGQQ